MLKKISPLHLVIYILALNNLSDCAEVETIPYDLNVEYKLTANLNIDLNTNMGKVRMEDFKTNQNQIVNVTTVTEGCVGDAQFCNLTKEEYVEMLNNYIYPHTYEWVLIGTHTVVFIAGLVGNALVVIAVYRNHTMRTVTNYFIANLAVADFMVILFCLPPTVLWDVTETWFLGHALCKVLLYFQVSCCFIKIEYCFIVLHNYRYRHYIDVSKVDRYM